MIIMNRKKPWYLEECSSTLATTFSSGNPGFDQSVITSDMDGNLRAGHLCTLEHTGILILNCTNCSDFWETHSHRKSIGKRVVIYNSCTGCKLLQTGNVFIILMFLNV